MHRLDLSILEEFRRDPSKAFSTTELVRDVFKEEFAALNRELRSGERHAMRHGYALKARLHRKLLYHLNQLVGQGLVRVSGVHGKGEKLFSLVMENGEVVVQGPSRRLVIPRPESVATKIDGDERAGFVRKYQPQTWLSKHDAILIDAAALPSLVALQQRLQQIYPVVSDAVAIDRFEHLLLKAGEQEAREFFETLTLDARDYGVSASVCVTFGNPGDERLLPMLRSIVGKAEARSLNFVFSVTPRSLAKQEAQFRDLISLFSEAKWKLTLKNQPIFAPTLFFGRAGPYAIAPEDWEHYQQRSRGVLDCSVAGNTTIVVDVKHYFSAGGTMTNFRELVERAGHALFEIDEQRRRHLGESFATLQLPSIDAAKEFFKAGRYYIRFWNYEIESHPIVELLGSLREELDRFCTTQETIFRSCGLPIRFRVALSSAFAKFDQDFFSERQYAQGAVGSVRDLQTKEMRAYLAAREMMCKTFEGADRVRFFIARNTSSEESLRMARYLLGTYDLPSVTFDFRGRSGETKLTPFLEAD